MIHPAPGGKDEKTPRIIGRALSVFSVLMLLGPNLPPAAGYAESQEGKPGVLVFLDDTEYHWADAAVEQKMSALCATIEACRQLGLSLNYTMSQYGAFVTEIGDREAPADFSWWWEVLLWNRSASAWQEAPAGASDLKLASGDSICWCANSSAPPAPNPKTRYPWPCFRGNTRNTGTGAAGGITDIYPISRLLNATDQWYAAGMKSKVERHLRIWERDLQNAPIDAAPAVANGKVFVSTGGVYNWTTSRYEKPPHIYALWVKSGEIIWERETTAAGWQVSSPACAPGRVLAGTSDGQVLCLSEANGSVEWTFRTGASPTGITASPVIAGGAVYVAGGDGLLHALSLAGAELWNFSLGGPAYMCTPALAGGRLVAGSDGGVLSCVFAGNGTPLWNFSAGGRIRASPVIQDGVVYFVSTLYTGASATRSTLHALSLEDGRQLWNTSMNASTSSPAVTGDRIFAGTASGVSCFDHGGALLWSRATAAPVQSSPVSSGGKLYYTVNDDFGSIRCLDEKTVTEDWFYLPEPAQYLICSPAIADGNLFVGSDNGKVYRFGAKGDTELFARLEPSEKPVAGRNVSVTVRLENRGILPVKNVTVNLSVDERIYDDGVSIGNIYPGETVVFSFNWTPKAGKHKLGVYSDPWGSYEILFVNIGTKKEEAPPVHIQYVYLALLLGSALALATVLRKQARRGGGRNEEK